MFPTESGQPDYNALKIDPVHNAPTCNGYNSGDHAGPPENAVVKRLVTGGGRGVWLPYLGVDQFLRVNSSCFCVLSLEYPQVLSSSICSDCKQQRHGREFSKHVD